MRLFFLTWLMPSLAMSQALQEINYSYLYKTGGPFTFRMVPVKSSAEWIVHFELQVAEGSESLSDYTVQWEQREDLGDKKGVDIGIDSVATVSSKESGRKLSGTLRFPVNQVKGVLSAKVISLPRKQVWFYPLLLREDYPVDAAIRAGDEIVTRRYLNSARPVEIVAGNDANRIVSYYSDEFPPAAPPFSEALARVSSTMATDSTFRIQPGQQVRFTENGLYLIQRDTAATQGIAFRVYDDYPKYSKLENLVDPLTYVCTRQELDRLKDARGEKRVFDRTILNMTGDAERARNFMRSYFRRVEDANEFFGSYKEGWKTDRGMIYIIFGPPDEVFKFEDREVWNYDNGNFKIGLSFVRSSTLFDPDNYVLVRQKKHMLTWYEVIDLWRNARF